MEENTFSRSPKVLMMIILSTDSISDRMFKEWDYEKNSSLGFESPLDILDKAGESVHWRCLEHGHEWSESLIFRAVYEPDCVYCSGRKVLKGFNDLATVGDPDIVAEWHPTKNGALTPDAVLSNSIDTIHWKCKTYGHEWKSMVKNRVNGASCPTCLGKKLLKGFNDLASLEEYDTVVAQWHPTKNGKRTPRNTPFGYSGKLWWHCADYEDHEWVSTLSHRVKGKGCLICAIESHKDNCRQAMFEHTQKMFVESKVPVTLDSSAELVFFNGEYVKNGDTVLIPVDAYNAEFNIVLIFDDQFNHGRYVPNTNYRSDVFGKDYDETVYLLNSGYRVIRIQEHAAEGKLDIHSFDNVGRLKSLSLRDNLISVSYKSFGENKGNLENIIGNIVRKNPEWFN